MSVLLTLSDAERQDARGQPTYICSYHLTNSNQIRNGSPCGEWVLGSATPLRLAQMRCAVSQWQPSFLIIYHWAALHEGPVPLHCVKASTASLHEGQYHFIAWRPVVPLHCVKASTTSLHEGQYCFGRLIALVVQWLVHCTVTMRSWFNPRPGRNLYGQFHLSGAPTAQPTQLWWVDQVFAWLKVRWRGSDRPSPCI